jgi:hypothetical protein
LPVSVLADWYVRPVERFLASIFAPATTAPPGSETVPVIVPRSLCAKTAVLTSNNNEKILNGERTYGDLLRASK